MPKFPLIIFIYFLFIYFLQGVMTGFFTRWYIVYLFLVLVLYYESSAMCVSCSRLWRTGLTAFWSLDLGEKGGAKFSIVRFPSLLLKGLLPQHYHCCRIQIDELRIFHSLGWKRYKIFFIYVYIYFMARRP